MKNFYVVAGIHKDPNKIETIVKSVEKIFGPFEEIEANNLAKSLIQKNIDDFYHRAWVVKSDNLTK
ncbi:hypothetical protein N8910_04625 [Candidatus Pelagibacter ubique]|nr:hypothetical protein [Candidatus Pelagibacter ubique]